MAGTPKRITRKRFAGGLLLLASVFVLLGPVAGRAQAQVPPVPNLPPLPAPIADAIKNGEGTMIPVVVQGEMKLDPAVNAVGFALRPGCSAAGASEALVILEGEGLPYDPGFLLVALTTFCGAAYATGPADGYLDAADALVGGEIEGHTDPVVRQAHDALDPVRPSYARACAAAALYASAPEQLPPPLNRVNPEKIVC